MMDPIHPPVEIEQTRNRHSRAFVRGDTIVIRLAGGLSRWEQERHIQNLLRRMSKAVLKMRHLKTVDPLRPLLNGEGKLTVQPVIGPPCTFELNPGKRTKSKRTPEGWNVTIGPRVRRATLHRLLWKLIGEYVRKDLESFMDDINDTTLQVSWDRLRIGYATSQWGSCSMRGVIMLNSVLLFTTPDILRYVIVHEFAHRIVPGHTPSFWRAVERGCPDHKALRKELRTMRICRL